MNSQSRLGLQQTHGTPARVRGTPKAPPKREGPLWATVQVITEHTPWHRVLAQPVCASAAERNWSVYGAIKTTARGTMGHAVADKRVYCHEAHHLKGKLQTASYKQAVEKWDSDSDSDVSSDEDDLKM